MTITQTIDIPANRRITLEVPPEFPIGPAIVTFTIFDVPNEQNISGIIEIKPLLREDMAETA